MEAPLIDILEELELFFVRSQAVYEVERVYIPPTEWEHRQMVIEVFEREAEGVKEAGYEADEEDQEIGMWWEKDKNEPISDLESDDSEASANNLSTLNKVLTTDA